MITVEELNRLGPDALRELLSGPTEQVAETMRAAAEGGSVDAQLLLGQMLLDGHGLERDRPAALRWFDRAARAGSAMAMNMIGRCCEHGWGCAVDPSRAAEWYRAAASRGLDWGMYNLATLLALGRGVAEDKKQALELFRRASALGHAKSSTMIGSFHEDGWVVDRDLDAATGFYRQGAEGGDFRGQFNLARMLIDGGNAEEGCSWLRRSVETATPAFIDQVRAWQAAHPHPVMRMLKLDAIDGEGYANASH